MSKRPNGAGQPAGILARQPVAREARHDAPADQRDQHHDDREAEADAVFGRAGEMRFEMEARCCPAASSDDQRYDLQIAPVAARDDLARRSGGDQQQECRRRSAQRGNQPIVAGERHRNAAREPGSSSTISGVPCSGSRPVQFGIAVSRKPVTTAGT